MSQKVKVPEGMLKAAVEIAWADVGYPAPDSIHNARVEDISRRMLEAALGWLDKQMPQWTDEPEYIAMKRRNSEPTGEWVKGWCAAVSAVRRMYWEPEVPEAIKDLLWDKTPANNGERGSALVDEAERRILEAYHRGLKERK